jgi:ribosomal protein S18 acetylase RimI-like enzyme
MSIEVQVISGVGDEDVNAINRLLSARGQGVGEALAREAVRLARTAGARTVDLTSRPSREAASRLYERLGFRLRDTRAYRLADTSSDQERHT